MDILGSDLNGEQWSDSQNTYFLKDVDLKSVHPKKEGQFKHNTTP